MSNATGMANSEINEEFTLRDTGINAIEAESTVEIFTIDGRKVTEATAPGLYIVNGKKILVK